MNRIPWQAVDKVQLEKTIPDVSNTKASVYFSVEGSLACSLWKSYWYTLMKIKGASPNYFCTLNVIVTLRFDPPPSLNVTFFFK